MFLSSLCIAVVASFCTHEQFVLPQQLRQSISFTDPWEGLTTHFTLCFSKPQGQLNHSQGSSPLPNVKTSLCQDLLCTDKCGSERKMEGTKQFPCFLIDFRDLLQGSSLKYQEEKQEISATIQPSTVNKRAKFTMKTSDCLAAFSTCSVPHFQHTSTTVLCILHGD